MNWTERFYTLEKSSRGPATIYRSIQRQPYSRMASSPLLPSIQYTSGPLIADRRGEQLFFPGLDLITVVFTSPLAEPPSFTPVADRWQCRDPTKTGPPSEQIYIRASFARLHERRNGSSIPEHGVQRSVQSSCIARCFVDFCPGGYIIHFTQYVHGAADEFRCSRSNALSREFWQNISATRCFVASPLVFLNTLFLTLMLFLASSAFALLPVDFSNVCFCPRTKIRHTYRICQPFVPFLACLRLPFFSFG